MHILGEKMDWEDYKYGDDYDCDWDSNNNNDDHDWVGNDDENDGNGDDENTWKALLRCVALLIGRSDTWSMMSFNTITSWALIRWLKT